MDLSAQNDEPTRDERQLQIEPFGSGAAVCLLRRPCSVAGLVVDDPHAVFGVDVDSIDPARKREGDAVDIERLRNDRSRVPVIFFLVMGERSKWDLYWPQQHGTVSNM